MGYLGTKPANQVIDSTLIADGTVTPSDLSTGRPYWDTSGNLGVGTSSPNIANGYTNLVVSDTDNGGIVYVDRANGARGYFYANGTTSVVLGNTTSIPLVFNTADTERMRIDASGRVTMQYQPAFQASISVSKSNVSVSPNGVATFSDVPVNRGSHFNGTRFTAPVSGIYRFGGSTATLSNSTFRTDLYKNGGLFTIVAEHSDGVSWTIKGWSAIMQLNAGDYAELAFFGTVNGSWTSFNGNLLG